MPVPDGAGTGERRGIPPLADDDLELYERAPCGHVAATPDGTIVRANATFLDWTGFTREQVVGRRFQDLLTMGGRIYHETHYAPLLRMQGHVREIAVDVVAADGRRLPALVNSVLDTDAAGRPLLVRTAVFPAEDRREYERELRRQRERAERSEARARVLAQTLQASLIPPAPPAVPGLDVGAVYRPAGAGDEVGGDFYDVFAVGGGAWAVMLGDVQGKGPQAAAVTALARYTTRAAAMQARDPIPVLAQLNQALLQAATERFCTLVYASVSPLDGGRVRLRLASGGHAPPVCVRGDGTVVTLGEPGSLLGVIEQGEWHEADDVLEPGDLVAFFTDGITEGRRDGRFYGDDAVRELLRVHRAEPAAGLAQRLVEDVVGFQGGHPRDDIAVVVLKVPVAGPTRSPAPAPGPGA